jgi:hypothetical protein
MKRQGVLLLAALVGATGAVLGAGPAVGAAADSGHAVFVQTNNVGGNTIKVLNRAADGSLTPGSEYPTGGLGGTEKDAPLDALASQGSLVLAGDHLFAVNAGSDSITVFDVAGSRLSNARVVPSGGRFPVSIAVHEESVYVLNAGGEGSVQGFRMIGDELVPLPGDKRSLGLHNDTPPVHISAPAQVGVTPDGGKVVVTTKNHNTIDVFDSHGGWLSRTPVATPSATPVPFAFSFDYKGDLVVTEAATSSVSSYRVNADDTLTQNGKSVSDGQQALCWLSQVGGPYFYGANAGSNTISSFVFGPDGAPILVNPTAISGGGGPIDMATVGVDVYVQNAVDGTVSGYWVTPQGQALFINTVGGLPAYHDGGMEGIAAN